MFFRKIYKINFNINSKIKMIKKDVMIKKSKINIVVEIIERYCKYYS